MDRLPFAQCQPLYDALGLKFHPEQLEILKARDRFPVIGGGERGGKSYTTAAIMLPHIVLMPKLVRHKFFDKNNRALRNLSESKPRSPDFILFGPTYAEPREEFKYLELWLGELGLLADGVNKPSKPQDGPWRMVTKMGVVIQTWSMDDPGSIRSVDPEGAAICEAGKVPFDGVTRVWGRVSGTKGFVVSSGTMEDAEQWYHEWMLIGKRANDLDLCSYSLPAWTNRAVFPLGIEDPEIKRLRKVYTDDVFAMRVAAEPRPPRLRVLKEVSTEHIKHVKFPRDAEIEIWIDPGYASAYAILWVAIWENEEGKRFHVFDEHYEQRLTTQDMIEAVKRKKLWPRVRNGVIDVAAKGRRDAGESALEIWQKRTTLHWNMKYWREAPLIERIRTSAKAEQFTISPRCRGLIAECGLGDAVFPEMHPWRFLADKSGRIISEKPIDKWNHSAKCLGYGLLHHLGQVESSRKPTHVSRLNRNTKRKAA